MDAVFPSSHPRSVGTGSRNKEGRKSYIVLHHEGPIGPHVPSFASTGHLATTTSFSIVDVYSTWGWCLEKENAFAFDPPLRFSPTEHIIAMHSAPCCLNAVHSLDPLSHKKQETTY